MPPQTKQNKSEETRDQENQSNDAAQEHEALRKLKLPRIRDFGEAQPSAEVLEKYKDLSSLGIGDLRGRPSSTTIFNRQQVERQSEASEFTTRLMDLNADSTITLGELAEFQYRADQAGNRDGRITVVEYNKLFAVGFRHYVSDQGKQAGLTPETQALLDGRLASGRYGITGRQGLPDALDLSQENTDDILNISKANRLAACIEQALEAAPEGTEKDLMKLVLGKTAETGSSVQFIGKNDAGNLLFASDRLKSETRNGVTDYRAESSTFEYLPPRGDLPGQLRALETLSSKNPLRIRALDTYAFPPGANNPALVQLYNDVKKTLQSDPDTASVLQRIDTQLEKALEDPKTTLALLKPLHDKLQAALGVDPKVPLSIELRDPRAPNSNGSYQHPQPGSNLPPKLQINLAPRFIAAQRDSQARLRQGVNPRTVIREMHDKLRDGLIATLLEENFHARQHQLADQYAKDKDALPENLRERSGDYHLNRETLVTDPNLENYFGDDSAYRRQPIEEDAKRFRENMLRILKGIR